MFDIGFWELVLVGIVALVVLGPERLPGAVRTTVLLVRRARYLVAQVKAEVERELALEEVKVSLERGGSLTELKALEEELRQPIVPVQPAEKERRRLNAVGDDNDSA